MEFTLLFPYLYSAMRKSLIGSLACVACLFFAVAAHAQDKVSDKDFGALIEPLSKENWKSAETISLSYLGRFKGKEDTADQAAILRYMYIRCVGARLAAKQYTPAVALAKVKRYTGKKIITPVLQYKSHGVFNLITLNDDSTALFLCGANIAGTQIQTFEHYTLNDTAALAHVGELEGHNIRMFARIKTITTAGVTMPRFEIALDNTDIYDAAEQ